MHTERWTVYGDSCVGHRIETGISIDSTFVQLQHIWNSTSNTSPDNLNVQISRLVKDLMNSMMGNSISESLKDKLTIVEIRRSKAFEKWNKKANAKLGTSRTVEMGDLVSLRNHTHSGATRTMIRKLLQLYSGPYYCIRKISNKFV